MRGWIKVKHRRTADVVVGGYRVAKNGDGVGSLLLGLYDDAGNLHYVGHTSSFKAAERRAMREALAPLEGGVGFGDGARSPGGQSRWSAGREEGEWVSLDPVLVCEVALRADAERPVPPRGDVRALARRPRARAPARSSRSAPSRRRGRLSRCTTTSSSALLYAAAEQEARRTAGARSSARAKEAWRWPEEAASMLEAGRPLTELRSVGPWVAEQLEGWIADPPAEVPAFDETRRGFLTYAQINEALALDPARASTPHGDLQMHTTGSDGRATLEEMVSAARIPGERSSP